MLSVVPFGSVWININKDSSYYHTICGVTVDNRTDFKCLIIAKLLQGEALRFNPEFHREITIDKEDNGWIYFHLGEER